VFRDSSEGCAVALCVPLPPPHTHTGTNFTSGALYSEAEHDAAAAAEKARLQALRDNEELPLVYLDVSIQGQAVGRITFVLFTKEAPRAGRRQPSPSTCHKCMVHQPLHVVVNSVTEQTECVL
jgi:hypothetical protein